MIARTVGGLCLVAVPGLVLLMLADAQLSLLILVGLVPIVSSLTVVALSWSVTGQPA